MSGTWFQIIFDPIGVIINTVLGEVFDNFTKLLIDPAGQILIPAWEWGNKAVFEPVMNFLGFNDEVLRYVSLGATRLYDDSYKKNVIKEQLTIFCKRDNYDTVDVVKGFMNRGKVQLTKYYNIGKKSYIDYLPDSQVFGVSIDRNIIKLIIERIEGTSINLLSVDCRVPDDTTWAKYELSKRYGYNITTDYVKIGGKYYKIGRALYNHATDITTVPLEIISSIGIYKYAVNTYTYTRPSESDISVINETTVDTWYRKGYGPQDASGKPSYYILRTDITTTVVKIIYVAGIEYSKETVSTNTTTTEEQLDTEPFPGLGYGNPGKHEITTSSEATDEKPTVNTNIRHTTRKIINVLMVNGNFIGEEDGGTENLADDLSTSTTNTSSKVYLGYSSRNQSGEDFTLELGARNRTEIYYIATYRVESTGMVKTWWYKPSSHQYSTIDFPVQAIQNITVFPIVNLRNQFTDVDKYNKSNPPASITEDRYKATNKILRSLGLTVEKLIESYSNSPDINKVKDAFLFFGVCPNDESECVSRFLWECFNFVYYHMAPIESTNNTYAFAVKENPFNMCIRWTPKYNKTEYRVMGSVGKYRHTIQDDSITNEIVCHCIVEKNDDLEFGSSYTVTKWKENILYDSDGYELDHTFTNPVTRILYYTNFTGDPNADDSMFYFPFQSATDGVLDQFIGEDYYTNDERTPNEQQRDFVKSKGYDFTVPGQYAIVTSSEVQETKDLIMEKQVTETEVSKIVIYAVSSFHIIDQNIDTEDGCCIINMGDPKFLIPLPEGVAFGAVGVLDTVELLEKSMYLLFYCEEEKHLKWYETEEWGAFLNTMCTVVSIIVTVLTFWFSGPAGGFTVNLALRALIAIAISVALSLTVQFILDNVDDPTLKAILVAGAMVAATVAGNYFSGGVSNAVLATQLVTVSMNAAAITMKDITDKGIQELQEESEDFFNKYEKESKRYDEILADINDNLDPEVYLHAIAAEVEIGKVFSPKEFVYISTKSLYDFDLMFDGLYDSTVKSFVKNKLELTGE